MRNITKNLKSMMMMGTALLYQAMTVSAQTATTSAQTLTAVSQVSTQPVADKATGVEVDHLGVSNTLVRVTGEGKYLLLPVQEANDDARINVLVDGNVVETIRVRLAKSKIDYSVPYNLSPYKGKNVILDIVTSQGRSSVVALRDFITTLRLSLRLTAVWRACTARCIYPTTRHITRSFISLQATLDSNLSTLR